MNFEEEAKKDKRRELGIYQSTFEGWDNFNWDPIANLILRTRYKKFSKILERINTNYVENSRKLLQLYPKQSAQVLQNRDKQKEGESCLSQMYINSKETIGSLVK